jgi:hypothetical protein
MAPKNPLPATREIIARLKTDLDQLIQVANETPPSSTERRRLDVSIREMVEKCDTLLRDLDPVRQPKSMFDPGNPAVVGRFVALAMIAQPRSPLTEIERFYGSGIYALYYSGEFSAYAPIRGTETPIYVGKADPQAGNAKTPRQQGERLSSRLKDHARAIGKASSTLSLEDFQYRSLVVQSGWQEAAEAYLIRLFQPIWNDETRIAYGLGKHGDDPKTRSNKRSPWDTLHPGRDWAHRDPGMLDARAVPEIISDLEKHFADQVIFKDLEQLLAEFIQELRQI